MKTLYLLLAILLPASYTRAEEKGDTVFHVKDKIVSVDVDGDKTKVKVFDKDSVEQKLTRELEFIDGREVENVYVGSPFMPARQLNNINFRPHFPSVWIGMSYLSESFLSGNDDGIHGRRVKSFELGVTPVGFAVPLGKSGRYGLSFAAQIIWKHLCFDKDYGLSQPSGDLMSFTRLNTEAKGNNFNYLTFKIPVLYNMYTGYDTSWGLGLSGEVRTNARYRLTMPGENGGLETSTLRTKRFGLNMEVMIGFGPLTITASVGLTPLFKSDNGKKAYNNSVNVGIDIPGLVGSIKSKKNKGKVVEGTNAKKSIIDN